jgi:hypothetical protein
MDTKNKKSQYIYAFALSAMLAMITIAVLTVAGDLYKPLKSWLAETFYHHWVGKGVISFVGLFVLGYAFKSFVTDKKESLPTFLMWMFWIGTLSAVVITGFYYYEAFMVSH